MRNHVEGRPRHGAGGQPGAVLNVIPSAPGAPRRDERGRVTVEYAVMLLVSIVAGLIAFHPLGGPIWIWDWWWRFFEWLSALITAGGRPR